MEITISEWGGSDIQSSVAKDIIEMLVSKYDVNRTNVQVKNQLTEAEERTAFRPIKLPNTKIYIKILHEEWPG